MDTLCHGEMIYPLELEDTLHHRPAVKMAAVIGVPTAKAGEAARAFVVLEAHRYQLLGLSIYLCGLAQRPTETISHIQIVTLGFSIHCTPNIDSL